MKIFKHITLTNILIFIVLAGAVIYFSSPKLRPALMNSQNILMHLQKNLNAEINKGIDKHPTAKDIVRIYNDNPYQGIDALHLRQRIGDFQLFISSGEYIIVNLYQNKQCSIPTKKMTDPVLCVALANN